MKHPEIKKRFEQILNERNITARELACRSGVNETSISQYVNGRHAPSSISSSRMSEVLGVNSLWLMGYDVPMSPCSDAGIDHKDPAFLLKYIRLSPRDQKIIDQMIDSMLEGRQ